jgi:hypothetical protein
MIEHMVLLKFSPDTTALERREVARRLVALKDQIPGIIGIVAGENFSARSKGFDLGLCVRFPDRERLAVYGPHPRHQEVYRYMEQVGLQDVIAVDFEF